MKRCERISLFFHSPSQAESLSKTLESRSVIRRATLLGSKSLGLLPLKPLELKCKRYRTKVFPRDPSLRANDRFPQKFNVFTAYNSRVGWWRVGGHAGGSLFGEVFRHACFSPVPSRADDLGLVRKKIGLTLSITSRQAS